MIPLLLKFVVTCSALVALCIGLIRAQPYDDGGLRDFLFHSPGCEIEDDGPCLMGIRPGLTTLDEAAALLETHEWVSETRVIDAGYPTINFGWSAQAPPIIEADCGGTVYGGTVYTRRDVVTEVVAACVLVSNSDLMISLGTPEQIFFYMPNPDGPKPRFWYSANFADAGLALDGPLRCPVTTQNMWDMRGTLTFRQPMRLAIDTSLLRTQCS